MNDSYRMSDLNQAAMNERIMYQQGLTGYDRPRTVKDPSVSNAHDAVQALEKRKRDLEEQLSLVDGWKAELARIERMLAASKDQNE